MSLLRVLLIAGCRPPPVNGSQPIRVVFLLQSRITATARVQGVQK
jgi:hypothetical protein